MCKTSNFITIFSCLSIDDFVCGHYIFPFKAFGNMLDFSVHAEKISGGESNAGSNEFKSFAVEYHAYFKVDLDSVTNEVTHFLNSPLSNARISLQTIVALSFLTIFHPSAQLSSSIMMCLAFMLQEDFYLRFSELPTFSLFILSINDLSLLLDVWSFGSHCGLILLVSLNCTLFFFFL